MFSSAATILSTMSMSTATTVHVILVLNAGKIAQEEKNAAAVNHVLLIQLPMSTTSHIWDPVVCIASSEYAYIVDFLTDQWEFIYQPSIQPNYNAKRLLLSSHNYLQIWKMDIIFITYLPP
jgi:hypothetical protein